MDVKDAATQLGVSPRRVIAMIAAGQIDATRTGHGWEVSELPSKRSRRPLSPKSRLILAQALHTRSLSGLKGQERARTASRIRELRGAAAPAKLLAEWWGGKADGPLNFGTNLVQHAIEGDEAYVVEALHRHRREYLRRPEDLADAVSSERRIRGLTIEDLADQAMVSSGDVRAIERAAPMTSPASVRRVLKALEVEPTALPDLVLV